MGTWTTKKAKTSRGRLAHLLLNAVQQRPVGLVGGGEGHHGEQFGLLADDALLRGKPSGVKHDTPQ